MTTTSIYSAPFTTEDKTLANYIQVKLDDQRAAIPRRQHAGDAGYDLAILDEISLLPQSFTDVATGISVKLPSGLWARITGRSSTVRTWALQVQEAVIDGDYTGPLFVGVWNLNPHPVLLPAGTRIAQLILHRLETAPWVQVDELPETSRGSSGFGSTGK